MTFINKVSVFILLFFVSPLSAVWAQPVVDEGTAPEQIAGGFQFTEGPVWHTGGYLLFSDIPANTIYKWTADKGTVEFLKPSGHSNGLIFDAEGSLLLAQHDGAVSKLTAANQFKTIVDSYNGKRLNSPNDLTVKSDGAIYFTDPPFGVSDEAKELDINGVYRYSKENGLRLVADDFALPNGIAFSPDESRLYVNDTRYNHIRVFAVKEDGMLANGRVFAKMESGAGGAADGMKVDTEGNLYSTGPGGIWVFSPEGEVIQQVGTPERITNLAWGGLDYSTLFLTAPNAVYRLKTNQKGNK